MKRIFSAILVLALVLTLVPAVSLNVNAAETLSLTWSQGTYYDNAINSNLVSRKYTVVDCNEGDVFQFTYPTANWAIYVYYADANGSYGYVTSKKGANETFVVEAINGRVPTQLRLTTFHRSGNNVTITEDLWATFDVTVTKTSLQPTEKTFTFATQNVGLWNDGVTMGMPADKVDTRAAEWQAVMAKHDIDILVGQEWQPYLDSDKTVDANEKVFGDMYDYMYGNNTTTYDGKNIISRTPLTDITYTGMVSNVGRRYAKAYTSIGGKRVCIINAHLSFEEDINVNRKEEMVELLNIAQTEKYVIIAGDFNVYTADEFEIFEEAGYSLANAGAFGEFNTWPNLGRNPNAQVNRVIDNIIVSPGIKIHSALAEDHRLSDHALLVAELELLEDDEITDNRLMCEHCNQFVTWTPITATNGGTGNAIMESGHYYLPKDLPSVNSQFYIGDTTYPSLDVIIDLRGHAVKASGRAFYMRRNSNLTIVDTVGCGTVSAGGASTGGLAYVERYGSLNLYDGSLIATNTSAAKKGGAIYLETDAKMDIKGGDIHGSYGIDGGVVCGGYTNVITMDGGAVYGSSVTGNGGVFNLNAGTLTINDGEIYGSEATGTGGAIYVTGGTVNMNGGTIYGGTSKGSGGGAIYANRSTLNLYGGTITGGTGPYGGNVHGTNNATLGIINLGACNIYGGTASGAGKDIYLSGDGKLKVLKAFAGTSHIAVNTAHLPDKNPGDALNTALDSAEGHFPGKLILDSLSSKPQLCGADGETALYIASAALADEQDNLTWYAHNKSAVAHYKNAAYLLPAAGNLPLTGGNYVVDLSGKNLNITGSGTVSCFDSSNDTYQTYGTATIEGATLANTGSLTVKGKEYITVNENGTYSFHRLGMGISGVSIRPSITGIYFKGTWTMDALLESKIANFGVAVSLVDMPTETFMTADTYTLWTVFNREDMENGKPITSVMIQNILKTGATNNDARGKSPIYAATYVVFENGTLAVSDKEVKISFYDVMKLADEKAYEANADALEKLYTTWADPMSGWGFTNIGK